MCWLRQLPKSTVFRKDAINYVSTHALVRQLPKSTIFRKDAINCVSTHELAKTITQKHNLP